MAWHWQNLEISPLGQGSSNDSLQSSPSPPVYTARDLRVVFAFLSGWKKSKALFVIWKLYGIKISVSLVLFFTWGVWLFPTTMAALMAGWQKPKIFAVLHRKCLLSGALGCWRKPLIRRCRTRHQSHSIKLPFRVGVWGRCSGKLRAAVHCRSSVVL